MINFHLQNLICNRMNVYSKETRTYILKAFNWELLCFRIFADITVSIVNHKQKEWISWRHQSEDVSAALALCYISQFLPLSPPLLFILFIMDSAERLPWMTQHVDHGECNWEQSAATEGTGPSNPSLATAPRPWVFDGRRLVPGWQET